MKTTTRRKLDIASITAGAGLMGAAAFGGAAVGNGEHVAGLWVSAQMDRNGDAEITELIDYDFGALATDRHGIFRDVPGLDTTMGLDPDSGVTQPGGGRVTVESSTAPDDLQPAEPERLKIGDPNKTISGRHRYRIEYTLADIAPLERVDYDAVGTGWEVDLENIDIHVRAPWEFETVNCNKGSTGDAGGCEAEEVTPGHLRVQIDELDSGEGVTIEASPGRALAKAPPAPKPPRDLAPDDGAGLAKPAGLAAGAALLFGLPTARLVRRRGREETWAGGAGAADAAYGLDPPGVTPSATADVATTRIDESDLADLATIEFAPPAELTPPQGGILLQESVENEHAVAWLLEQASAGAVTLEGDEKKPTLTRGEGQLDPILASAFGARQQIELGKYDSQFAGAWSSLQTQLGAWQDESGLWSEGGEKARVRGLAYGWLLAIGGAALAALAAFFSGSLGAAVPAIAVGAAVGGVGVALIVRAWELRVRNVRGTGLWLRVESFRRFLAESEAQHADWAAEQGLLREYTAWAMALGEIDRWSRAVRQSSIAQTSNDYSAVHMATSAAYLSSATSSALTAPSSSGGGGGVGGGGGGGGGGSW